MKDWKEVGYLRKGLRNEAHKVFAPQTDLFTTLILYTKSLNCEWLGKKPSVS